MREPRTKKAAKKKSKKKSKKPGLAATAAEPPTQPPEEALDSAAEAEGSAEGIVVDAAAAEHAALGVAAARALAKAAKAKAKKLKRKAAKVDECIHKLQSAIESGTDVAALKSAIQDGKRLILSEAATGTAISSLLQAATERLVAAQVEHKNAAFQTVEEEFVAMALSQQDCGSVAEAVDDEDAEKLCVVCISEPKIVALIPCEPPHCPATLLLVLTNGMWQVDMFVYAVRVVLQFLHKLSLCAQFAVQ